MTEAAIQLSIVKYLDAVLPRSHRVFAVPNAATRTVGGRPANAVAGLRRGVPDLVIVGSARAYFLEVKTLKGRLSDHQKEWADWCLVSGLMPWACVHSLDEVRVCLAHWNIPTREA